MSSKVDLKVVLLGNAMSGKTSLVERYVYERFTGQNQSTVGAAFGAKTIQVDRRMVTMGIWALPRGFWSTHVCVQDTAGSERFEAMSKIYYRDAKAAIVCFDLTDRYSWNKVLFWVKEIKEREPNCAVYVCGTKEDLLESRERGMDELVVSGFCTDHQAPYFETSSRTGSNVDALFRAVAENYLRTAPEAQRAEAPSTVNLDAPATSAPASNQFQRCCNIG